MSGPHPTSRNTSLTGPFMQLQTWVHCNFAYYYPSDTTHNLYNMMRYSDGVQVTNSWGPKKRALSASVHGLAVQVLCTRSSMACL